MIRSYSFQKLVRNDIFVITFYDIYLKKEMTLKCEINCMDLATSYEGTRIVILDIENKNWVTVDTRDIILLKLENGVCFNRNDLYELALKLGDIDIDEVYPDRENINKDTDIISDIKSAISLYKDKNKPNYGSDF